MQYGSTLRASRHTAMLTCMLAVCGYADATMINFYMVTPNGTVGTLTDSHTFSSAITASAGEMDAATPKTLTVANFAYPHPDEVGLGVCSHSDTGSLCSSPPSTVKVGQNSSIWDGTVTEIDNLGMSDLLKLTATPGYQLTGMFILGSLDANGGTDYEDGYVTYGANTVRFSRSATGATITSGSATIAQAGSSFGADVFLLTITNFDRSIGSVTFGAGGTPTSGTNNDFLVAAADVSSVPVPVPAALWLLSSGLAGLAGAARRRRAFVASGAPT
jgi:hypothetical protein